MDKVYVFRITCNLLLKGSKFIRQTLSVLLRIAESSVDGRPIVITCGTNQQVNTKLKVTLGIEKEHVSFYCDRF